MTDWPDRPRSDWVHWVTDDDTPPPGADLERDTWGPVPPVLDLAGRIRDAYDDPDNSGGADRIAAAGAVAVDWASTVLGDNLRAHRF